MGMFDDVWVKCPKCETLNNVQSKVGECTLAAYKIDDAPLNVLADVDQSVITCEHCETNYQIVLLYQAIVREL